MSRIIGQCNTADFKSIEHLALAIDNPEMFDFSTLTNKQKLAVLVMAVFKEAGIKVKETFKIREMLFWDDGHVEFKFQNVPGARELMLRLNEPRVRRDFGRGINNIIADERR